MDLPIEQANELHPIIKFTAEISDAVTFLDTLVFRLFTVPYFPVRSSGDRALCVTGGHRPYRPKRWILTILRKNTD